MARNRATFRFDEGEKAMERGLEREDCPYPEGSTEREEWLAGFSYAYWAAHGDDSHRTYV